MTVQPFVPLANGAQVELKSSLFGEVVENRLWFRTRFDPVDLSLVTSLAIGVGSWYADQVMPVLSRDLGLYSAQATDWTTEGSTIGYNAPITMVGGVDEDSHSANVSIRVAFRGDTSQTFRNNSNFVPGIPLSATDGNYYSNDIRDALFDAYVSLIDLTFHFEPTHNWEWCITSRVLDRAYRSEQASSRTDFILFPSPVVSPRRRRLP